MKFSITFHEIEALIKAHYGLELKLRQVSDYEIRIQPRNMGFLQNRVKLCIAIEPEYDVPNRIKLKVSAGAFSPIVVPKVLGLLSELPAGCAATKEDGNIIILLDKFTQLANMCSMCEIFDIRFSGYTDEVEVSARFSNVKPEDYPEIKDYSFNSNVSIKEQEQGRIIMDIAHSIFESDKIDESVQTLKQKAAELKDVHGNELKEAALSFLQRLRANHIDKPTENGPN